MDLIIKAEKWFLRQRYKVYLFELTNINWLQMTTKLAKFKQIFYLFLFGSLWIWIKAD